MVIVIEKSQNGKTGLVSATYAPLITCSDKCPFKNGGCYGQDHPCAFHLKRINQEAKKQNLTHEQVSKIEAQKILSLSGKYPLRLHVVGDCRTTRAAKYFATSAKKFPNKIWTYTHSWRNIKRDAWGDVSVLASCETLEHCKQAHDRGYAPCLIVAEKFKTKKINGFKYLVCPEIARGIKCVDCKLCMNDRKLYEKKIVICIPAHGKKVNAVKSKVVKI